MFYSLYSRMQETLSQSSFNRHFQSTALANLIAQRDVPTPWVFFNTYSSSWWHTRLLFRFGIKDHRHDFDVFLNLRQILKKSGMLQEDNFNKAVNREEFPKFVDMLYYLQKAGILNQVNFAVVANHSDLGSLFAALRYLQVARMLNQDNFAVVAAHPDPFSLAIALDCLQKAGVLNPDNRTAVAAHEEPKKLALTIPLLLQAQILNQVNFDAIANLPDLEPLYEALCYLQMAGILNQDNFDALISPVHASLISEDALEIWSQIPEHLLTQDNFQRLLTAAEQANPMNELRRVRDQILGFIAPIRMLTPEEINHFVNQLQNNLPKSTHTTSVHRSVSASAIKLMNNYGVDLDVDTKLQEIKKLLNRLDDSPKHLAAKRCIERITGRDYHFTDSSGVSTRQLLALSYTAIHDDTKRIGTLHDAQILLIEGLYEIQRGYNLNEQGQDLDGEDNPICAAGTFNKLMEKLSGIHPDVKVDYITHQLASFKFPKLAEEQAIRYLQSLTGAQTAEDYRQVKDLLEQLKQDGSLEQIWDKIKAEVQEELWDEFQEAYAQRPDDARFLALIHNGQYLTSPDLSTVEKALLTSPGYQAHQDELRRFKQYLAYQDELLGFEQYSFWANRNASAQAQHQFDKHYGLVLKL